jgi:uncharacterized membrane protein YjjP (DUF1212 family)
LRWGAFIAEKLKHTPSRAMNDKQRNKTIGAEDKSTIYRIMNTKHKFKTHNAMNTENEHKTHVAMNTENRHIMHDIMSTEDKYTLLRCLLDMGEMLLESGAEINRVEDTITRMGSAYGAERTDVFVITSIISITLVFGDGYTATETRRVANEVGTDFRRIESVNALSRACCMDPLPVDKLRKRVDQVAEGHKEYAAILAGSILAAAGFAVFFGGSIADGAAAALFASVIAAAQKYLSGTRVKTIEANLIISLLLGLAAGILTISIPSLHMDKILIGDIMLLIPGIAMTNSIRNMLVGDTISGIVRLAESLMWAVSIAGGIMVALAMISCLN